ncbi:hypothetical protein FOZ62_008989, partial [Perkinsus olseni]
YDTGSVWIDVTNDDVPVPIYNNKIVAKVLRISWKEGAGSSSTAEAPQKAVESMASSVPTASSAPEVRSEFQSAAPSPPPPPPPPPPPRRQSGGQSQQAEANLLSGGESLRHAFRGHSSPSLGHRQQQQHADGVVGNVDFFGVRRARLVDA